MISARDELFQKLDSLILKSEKEKDNKMVAYYQSSLISIKDSIRSEEMMQAISAMNKRIDKEQKAADIALANAQNESQISTIEKQKLQQYVYMGGGIVLVAVVIGLLSRLSYMRNTRNEQKEKGMKIAIEKLRAEKHEQIRDDFLAKMSHEIRTPMNAIMGMNKILRKNKHYHEQEIYLDAIWQSSENLLVILNDILDLSKLEAGQVEIENIPFKPFDELMKLRDILKFKAEEKGVHMKCEMDPEIPEVIIGDPVRLSQILINLTGNAIKFTENGDVSVSIRKKELTGGKVVVEGIISDTGIGIPEDRIDKIFESFTQAESDTTRKYGGTGLGLTISKELIELQQGNINVTSKIGVGSTFMFTIPYEVGQISDLQEEEKTDSFVPLKKLRILLVEDNEFNIMVAKDELTEIIEDVSIELADTGCKAYEKVKQGNYDVVLMDIEMEEMNGYEAATAIRNLDHHNSKVPIIAITANAMPKEIQKCYDAGMDGHISKPFASQDLAKEIQKTLFKSSSLSK